MPTHFLGDLAFRHLVARLEARDALIKFVSLDALSQLALRLTRAKHHDSFRRAQASDDFVVVICQVALVFSLSGIIGRNHL